MPSNGVCLALMWFMRPHKGGQTTPAVITVLPCVLGLSACSTLMVTSTWIDAAADRRRRRPRRLGRPQPHRLALCARHESDACLVVSRVDRPFPSWRQPTKGKGKGEATPPQPSLAPMKAGAMPPSASICTIGADDGWASHPPFPSLGKGREGWWPRPSSPFQRR